MLSCNIDEIIICISDIPSLHNILIQPFETYTHSLKVELTRTHLKLARTEQGNKQVKS